MVSQGSDGPDLPDGGGTGARHRDGGGGRILLAEGMGLPDADGKESGAYHGDRGWYQERGQRGMQHGAERVLRVRRGKRRLRPCEGSDVRRKAVLYGTEGSQGRL